MLCGSPAFHLWLRNTTQRNLHIQDFSVEKQLRRDRCCVGWQKLHSHFQVRRTTIKQGIYKWIWHWMHFSLAHLLFWMAKPLGQVGGITTVNTFLVLNILTDLSIILKHTVLDLFTTSYLSHFTFITYFLDLDQAYIRQFCYSYAILNKI